MNETVQDKTQLARDWYQIQDQLAELKERESAMRKQVVSAFFGEELAGGTHRVELAGGTHRAELASGVHLIVTVPKKIDLDKSIFDSHKSELHHKGLIGDDRLIRVKYEVSATALRHLSNVDKAKFGDMFLHGTGSPQMKIEVKKG